MFKHVLIALFIVVPRADSFLNEIREYFVYEDVKLNDTHDCHPLHNQQYYWQSVNSENISETVKLSCLAKHLSEEKYFPKCCPPDHVYHRTHHKCVQNNMTDIHTDFGNENLLIRSDLFHCSVILDHIVRKDQSSIVTLNADRSLYLKGKSYKLGSYCLDNDFHDEEEFIVRTCEDIDVCRKNEIRCIKKCCPDGQYYRGLTCEAGPHFGLSLENNTRFLDKSENFHAVVKSVKCKRYIGHSKYQYYITEDGTTVIREMGVWKRYSLEQNYYCMEYVEMFNRHEILLCMSDNTNVTPKVGVKGVLLITSCVCLLLTLIGYFILPDLKNLIGNIIITYCSCLFVAFVLLTWLQFYPNQIGSACDVFAFAIAFFFLSAVAWMTVLSYEIWRVLGSMVTEYGHRLPGERKRYLQYSGFAWLISIVIIGISFLDHMYNIFPLPIHIILGEKKCVFENERSRGNYGYVFQFAAPFGIFLFINLVIFVKTIVYIFQVKSEIRKMKILDTSGKQRKWKTFVADKEKVTMVIRIFLLMGLNWLFETISSVFVDFSKNETLQIIEIIFDDFNALQGVFIFWIFMLKKKILKSLLKILDIKIKNRRSSVATCSTEVVMMPTSARTSRSH